MNNVMVEENGNTTPLAVFAQLGMAGERNTVFKVRMFVPESAPLDIDAYAMLARSALVRSLNRQFWGRHATVLSFASEGTKTIVISGSVQRPLCSHRSRVEYALVRGVAEIEERYGLRYDWDVRETRPVTAKSSIDRTFSTVSRAGSVRYYMNAEAKRLGRAMWEEVAGGNLRRHFSDVPH